MKLYHNTSQLPVNHNSIIRPRIDAMLKEAVRSPVVVVSGGAGFGKTQAVGSFLEHSAYYPVWQQLTILDNLPMRFWESFVYTVSLHRKSLGIKLEELGFPDTLYKFHEFLRVFAEEVYLDKQQVVFVFDDYHVITDPLVTKFFEHLVSAKLENICLVFITRKLEACYFKIRLHVLDGDDLRFTKKETEEYFRMQKIIVSHDSILQKIYSYTGGWPMALYLITRQMPKSKIWAEKEVIQSQQMLFTVIENEVFSLYTENERKFLILISMLSSFARGLIHEIGCLFNLEAVFLLGDCAFVSYDAQAQSFYFHQLFLDFLTDKQSMISVEEKQQVLLLAGDWCREHNYIVDAMHYFNKSGRAGKIWEIIRQIKGERRSQEEAELLINYIEKFPNEFMTDNIFCRLVYAMLLLNNFRIKESEAQLAIISRQLEHAPDTEEIRQLRGEVCVGEGLRCIGMGSWEFVDWFKKANELIPEGSRRWGRKLRLLEYNHALNLTSAAPGELQKSIAFFFEGMPYVYRMIDGAGYGLEYLAAAEGGYLTASLDQAEQNAYKALYMGQEKGQTDIVDNALFLLMRIYLVSGNTTKMEEILDQLRQRGGQKTGGREVADIALGWFYSEIREVDKVASWILNDNDNGLPTISVDKDRLLYVRCLIERGNYHKALAILDKLEKLNKQRNAFISLIYVNTYRGIAHYKLNQMEAAAADFEAAYHLAAGNQMIMPFIECGHKIPAFFEHLLEKEESGIPKEWLFKVNEEAEIYTKRHTYFLKRYQSAGRENEDYDLTQREIVLLRNMSQKLTGEEIEKSMNMSEEEVKSMQMSIYQKMGAINGEDAVRLASVSKLI